MTITMSDNSTEKVQGLEVPEHLSKSIFKRKADIELIQVYVSQSILK